MNKEAILKKVEVLRLMWQKGLLGGEIMPEDENPNLEKNSLENYLYFTLPMALNYQRNSYTLWASANKTYKDKETNFIFNPGIINNLFLNILSIAYLATYCDVSAFIENSQFATLLKFVSTGPGHKILICTLLYILLLKFKNNRKKK